MSNYQLDITNYKAIHRASIQLSGITVLAGQNGSGKSTISRWVYYLLRSLAEYKLHAFLFYKEEVLRLLNKISYSANDIKMSNLLRHAIAQGIATVKQPTVEQDFAAQAAKIHEVCLRICLDFASEMMNNSQNTEAEIHRVFSYLGADNSHPLGQQLASQFEKLHVELEYNLEDKQRSLIDRTIYAHFHELEPIPQQMTLQEDGVVVYDGNIIKALFHNHAAFYINTPMAIGLSDAIDSSTWAFFNHALTQDSIDSPQAPQCDIIKQYIAALLGGAFTNEKDKIGQQHLIFNSASGTKIAVEQVATGYKTLAYLQRLLDVGALSASSTLIIDEPEAHLHPQWIVEVANLLVMINKLLGTRILIASHNPDMVSAIRYISERQGTLAQTRFYLAKRVEGSEQYDYLDLNHDIEPVFETFNKSFDLIDHYANIE
ncbi:MAG: AAA family ATPase [Muribaculaceae bacterium]|nr:AAA family ATPase [Muribaculaceae bacterium]